MFARNLRPAYSRGINLLQRSEQPSLRFPHAEPPGSGELIEIADGILWTRIPLPFRLDHVNVFLIEDHGGWAVLDTGVDTEKCRQVWDALIGRLQGRPLTKVVVTHFHPDHIGLAGWLCKRFDLPLYTSQTTYLGCINISLRPGALEAPVYREFYLRHGLDPKIADIVSTQGHGYLRLVHELPPTFRRIVAGDTLKIGGREFLLSSGDGHAPEQIMLLAKQDGLFLAADQVLAKISPNVSVWAVDPFGDPLGLYLRSLRSLKAQISPDALVLPGHQLAFYGLHTRIDELIGHHEVRCNLILEACKKEAHSAAELVPVLFPKTLDPHQMSFAFSETQAHINYLLGRGEISSALSSDNIERVVCA
jgi:glyoxylase-like metal-dependent hydrolase (beta-lactamase superfamily II)